MARSVLLVYEGYRFLCSAERLDRALYRPVLVRRLDWPSEGRVSLLSDADTCRTEAEAIRHAEAQAMKWVHARTAHAAVLI